MKRAPLTLAATLTALAALTALGSVACDPEDPPKRSPSLAPRTSAPPGAITEYVEDRSKDERAVRLTEGVAMAMECRDTKGAPCLLDGTAVADESVAVVRRAWGDLDQTVAYGARTSSERAYLGRALFVVVGKKPGTTKLLVRTGEETVAVDVRIFPASGAK